MVAMARIPPLDEIYRRMSEEQRHRLDEPVEFRNLASIAHYILDWDGPVADELTLSKIDCHDIKAENKGDPRQQRRAVLNRWQEKFGLLATYRNLIIAFHNAQKMDYVEVVCQQLGGGCPATTPTTPGSGIVSGSLATATPALLFSESLTPTELTVWLSQELELKGLTLEEFQRQSLLNEHINGSAFMNLTDEHLKEFGFKLGQIFNIRAIISNVAESTETSLVPSLSKASTVTFVRDPTLTTQALDDALESLVHWYTLGIKLNLPSHKLDIIQKDCQGVVNQKVALYKLWLDTDTEASWDKLCEALCKVNKKVLATLIRTRYVTVQSNSEGLSRTRNFSSSQVAAHERQGSKVTGATLLECLHRLCDADVKDVGVALGVSSATLDELPKGQSLAEVIAGTYQNCGDDCKEISWSELDRVLVAAGHGDLAKRIEVKQM